jgi:hypothetical protein
VIDKTCRFSEGLGAVWTYGIDADERPLGEYSVESSRFPDERKAIDQAFKARSFCTKDEAHNDYEQITEKVILDVANGDADSAVRKLKEILLASRPSCRRNP